jgi:hypothetical protein
VVASRPTEHAKGDRVIGIRPIRFLAAAAQTARASDRRSLAGKLPLALATLVAAAVAALPAPASATTSALAPESLTRARMIRVEINAQYRLMPGRKLVVTEATTTGVVETLTLVTDWLDPRVVPADNGIYFAICSLRARCPYPRRSAAWRALAFLPRRQALELALRTLLETSVSLVVVALPTAEPVWVVFERDDLLRNIDGPAALEQLAASRASVQTPLRKLVDPLTRPRLFAPLPILPPPDDTIYATRLFAP